MVVSEPRGEKIDIIPWNTEPARFVAKALSPDQCGGLHRRRAQGGDRGRPRRPARAGHRQGSLNARLAYKLSGWKIDIKSDTEFAQEEAEAAFGGGDDEEFTGRCAAVLANGKRCPNGSVPGSRFCGIAAHRELAEREARGEDVSASVVQPSAVDEPEDDTEEALGDSDSVDAQPVEEVAGTTGSRPGRGRARSVSDPIRTSAGYGAEGCKAQAPAVCSP